MAGRRWGRVATRISLALFLAGLALAAGMGSEPLQRKLRRTSAKVKMRLAIMRGIGPRPLSIEGRLIAFKEDRRAIAGARVEALESRSGYGVMTDAGGRFVLPHLMWFPGATYTLIISPASDSVRQMTVRASARFPASEIQDMGDLPLESAEEVSVNPQRQMSYDARNDDYYRNLFEVLSAGQKGDEAKVKAVCRFVAGRLNYNSVQPSFPNAREVIRLGSRYCGQLALAMAALTTAGDYPTRTVQISDTPDSKNTHVVVEVYYGDGWHLFDPTYGVQFFDSRGEVASYREIRLNPTLVTDAAFAGKEPSVVGDIMRWMPAAYGSGLHELYFENRGEYCSKEQQDSF